MLYTASPRPRGNNFELWSWLFMRISGLVLVLMVLVHLAIMHIFTPIQDVNYRFVAARYATPLWRWYDIIMLGLALVHGMNGARVVADDLIHSRGWRLTVMALLYLLTFVFLVIGAQVILSFQPAALR